MVKSIRNIEKACSGDGLKKPSKSEIKNISIVRKSLYNVSKVQRGDLITEKKLIPLRPGDGISPMNMDTVIGKKFNKDLEPFSKLKYSDFE